VQGGFWSPQHVNEHNNRVGRISALEDDVRRHFGWALASVASLVIGGLGAASAADMAVKARPAPVAAAPFFDWSGFYIGGEVGGAWTRTDGSFVFPPPATWRNSSSTGIGGGFVGYQYQFSNKIVFGVEANVLAPFDQNQGSSPCNPLASCGAGLVQHNSLDQALWSVGPRLGWAAGQWMPYATGGYAATRRQEAFLTAAGAVVESSSNNLSGWYVGGGVDWMLSPTWILGVEYRHYDFGTQRSVPVGPTGVAVVADTIDQSTRLDTVTARISYKFGGPIVAKY
jgi:outer membrane immunogenic protein